MTPVSTTDIEKENLEAHVELCWERYRRLEEKVREIETKVDRVGDEIKDMRVEYLAEIKAMRSENQRENRSLKTAIISSSATVIVGLLGLLTMIVTKMG
jgi:chromosome segregation ATPase